MLTNSRITTMLPVTDVARARRFYEESLGLRAKRSTAKGEIVFHAEGGEFALYPREKPPVSDHTALTFEVRDVATEVKELSGRGVRFEDYPDMHTRDGIAELGGEKAAWFKDPDGNILCVHEGSPETH